MRSGLRRNARFDQIAERDLALAHRVGVLGFEKHHVIGIDLELGGVLDDSRRCVPGMREPRTFSKVVLPEPVPPEMMMFLAR